MLVATTVRIVERYERNALGLRTFERVGEHERLVDVLAQRTLIGRRIRCLEKEDISIAHVLGSEVSVHLPVAEVLDAHLTDMEPALTDLLEELVVLFVGERQLLIGTDPMRLRLDDIFEFVHDSLSIGKRTSGREEVEATS